MSLRKSILALCWLVASTTTLLADGFKFTKGRLADEPVIEIQLTKAQAALVRSQFKPGMKIKLTKRQQFDIRSKAKAKIGPTVLELWKPADLDGDCSCFLWNIGLIFKDGWVELPIHRIVSDKEAEERQPDPES
ncbi:hypothetical protein [Geothrix terrae]|uniref:hypothetical protein n=1 Tax=Geothrix terrae TaxID=2922720 RepID=UPI001FAC2126|nr:hypothetical protein [Geothrix terrae]